MNQILVRKGIKATFKNEKETPMQEHTDEVNELVMQLKSCRVKVNMDAIMIVYY